MARQCPLCQARTDERDVTCPGCGCTLDLRKYRAQRLSLSPDGQRHPWYVVPLVLIGSRLPGLLRPPVLIASLVTVAAAWGIALAAQLLTRGAVTSYVAMGPLAMMLLSCVVYMQAIAMLIDGRVTSLKTALSEFEGLDWCVFCSLLLLPITLMIGLS